MGILSKLIGVDTGKIIGGVIDVSKEAIDLIPNENEKNRLMAALNNEQIRINAIEAGNPKLFVSGWRPFIGWVCGFSLAYSYMVVPILGTWFVMQRPDIDTLYQLLLALLGMAGLRTIEKSKKVARS